MFNQHHAEHEMLRYLKRLEEKDIALNRSMIPLGSCTMKLNAAAEMIPITLPGFTEIHPFAPADQTQGYAELIATLAEWLKRDHRLCRRSRCSPMRARRASIPACWRSAPITSRAARVTARSASFPSSAHGTNPASAAMAGLQVVVVGCDRDGNIDVADLTREGRQARRQSRRADGDLSQHARRVRGERSARSARSFMRTAGRSTWTAPTSTRRSG